MKQSSFLILKTAAETDRALLGWAHRMSNEQCFELGRDPNLINRLEKELDGLNKQLEALDKYFEFGTTPARQVNTYYTARSELEKTAELVRDIRRQKRGSVGYTTQFLMQVDSCRHTFHEMIVLLQPNKSFHLH